jgi:hypothetical protein
MCTSLISLFSSSAASSAAGSASVTSSTFGLMDVAVGAQEVRRVETITGSRVWLSVGAGIEREALTATENIASLLTVTVE